MMKQFILSLLILFVIGQTGIAQPRSCQKEYDKVHELDNQSTKLFYTDEGIIMRKIEQSQSLVQKALAIAYKAIEKEDCAAYSIIVDRIIDLELRIGNPDAARKAALNRLDRLYPNWKNWDEPINIPLGYLSVLGRISDYKEEGNFYRRVLTQGRIYAVCGTVSYGRALYNSLARIESIYQHYGKKVCLRYFENTALVLHEDEERTIPIYNDIHELVIKSLRTQYSYEKLLALYDSATFQEESPQERYYLGYPYIEDYYLKIGYVKLYVKSNDYYKNQKNAISPQEFASIKNNATFYLKLKELAARKN